MQNLSVTCTEKLLKALDAKCASRVQNVQEQVNSLKSEFNTTVNRLGTELNQLGTGPVPPTRTTTGQRNRLRIKFYLFSGPANSNYNFPHQIPVGTKVNRESRLEKTKFQGRLDECPVGAVYHY